MRKFLLLFGIITLSLLELFMLRHLITEDRHQTPEKISPDCTYTLYLNKTYFCLQDDTSGFLIETPAGRKWEILNQTPTTITLFQPDGLPIKLKKKQKYLLPDVLSPDERMDIEYQKADYTPETPYVVLNPYGNTPLSALLRFKTESPARVRVTVQGFHPAPDLSFDYPIPTTDHQIPVFGLYPKHQNKLTLTVITDETSQEYPLTISTKEAGRNVFYQPLIKKGKGNRFYHSYDGLIYDEYGFIRYNFSGGGMIYIYPGEIISEHRQNGLTRWSPLGKKQQSYPYPQGFSSFTHGIGRMPNGNFLVIGTQTGTQARVEGTIQNTHRDIILELDYHTGTEVRRWDIGRILNPDRSVIVRSSQKDYGAVDWLHMNSVQFDTSDNSIVISGRHVGMVKFDYSSGKLKWVFGPALGYEKSGRDGSGPALWNQVLTAVDSSGIPFPKAVQQGLASSPLFQWPTTTHDAKVLGNGYFSIFNNDDYPYDKRVIAHRNSGGLIFKIDEKKKTIHRVWSFPTPFFSGPGSNITPIPDSNSVVVFLSEIWDKNSNLTYGRLFRVNRDTNEIMFEAVLHCAGNGWHYRLEPLDMSALVDTPTLTE